MAALGLLTSCRWDDDSAYVPQRTGLYLRVDSALYWLPEGRVPVRLPYAVLSITGTEKHLWALGTDGRTLWGFRAGSTEPQYSELLPYSVATLAGTPQQLYAGGPFYTGQASLRGKDEQPGLRWQWASSTPVSVLAAGSSFTGAAGGTHLLVLLPGKVQASFSEALPGPVQHLWVETPTGLGGTFRWQDTLYTFRYEVRARLLQLDTLRPAPYRKRLYSPYLKVQFGTEYLGSLTLSMQGVLSPPGLNGVEEMDATFLEGKVFVLRQDSVVEYALRGPEPPRLVGVFPGARSLTVVPVYRYGSAEITTR